MRQTLGRLLGTVVQSVLFVLVLSMLVAVALSIGVIDVGLDGTIELPGQQPASDEEATSDPISDDPGTTTLARETISSTEIEARIHERINAVRAENDLSKLGHDDTIASIARTHSHDMAEREYFSHVNPEGAGPGDRFGDLYPGKCRAVGENLALIETPSVIDVDEIAERIVTGWMNSKGHRENILTARWDTHGIGVFIEGDRVYTTQNFCDEW